MKIIELRGKSQVFNLNHNKSVRLSPYGTSEFSKSDLSDEIGIAVDLGLIRIADEEIPKPKIKKNGGNK